MLVVGFFGGPCTGKVKAKDVVVPVRALKAYRRMDIQLHTFLTSALYTERWSVCTVAAIRMV